MTTLQGKAVVITGAGSGIGRALALECARRGARLLLSDIDATGLAETCGQARGIGAEVASQQVDTGSEASITALAGRSTLAARFSQDSRRISLIRQTCL